MESDIAEYSISPYLSYFDLFKARNVNSDRRRAFEGIAREYIDSPYGSNNYMKGDIISYDDVELLRYAMYDRRTENPLDILSFQSFKYPAYAEKVARYFITHIDPYIFEDLFLLDTYETAAIIEMSIIYPWFYKEYIQSILSTYSVQQIHRLWREIAIGTFNTSLYVEFFHMIRDLLSVGERKQIQPYLLYDLDKIANRYRNILKRPEYSRWIDKETIDKGIRDWENDIRIYQPLLDNVERAIIYIQQAFSS